MARASEENKARSCAGVFSLKFDVVSSAVGGPHQAFTLVCFQARCRQAHVGQENFHVHALELVLSDGLLQHRDSEVLGVFFVGQLCPLDHRFRRRISQLGPRGEGVLLGSSCW